MKTILLFLSVFLSASLFGQNVYIPDANFKAYLVGNSEINTNGDTEIQVSEAGSYMWDIDITGYRFVSDLTGIEAFTALTELYLEDIQLTSLDISKNIALTILNCDNNQLTSLDVSSNTALEELFCDNNQLTSLDVSTNTALEVLYCDNNQLTSLDISKNIALTNLHCDNNQLTSLDVSKNSTLFRLSCVSNNFECVKGVSIYCRLPGEYRCDDSFNQSIDVSNTTYNPNLSEWEQEVRTSPNLANVNGKVVFQNAVLKCVDGRVIESTYYFKNDSVSKRTRIIITSQNSKPDGYVIEEFFKRNGVLKSKKCYTTLGDKIECP